MRQPAPARSLALSPAALSPAALSLAALSLAALSLTACAADSESGAEPEQFRGMCTVDADCPETDVCFDGQCIFQGAPPEPEPEGPAEPADPDPPEPEPPAPEIEDTFAAFGEPAAGRRFVWVVSPSTDAVARIDGETRAIGLIEVGDEPSVVRAVGGADEVVVLARGSDELFRIRHADGVDTVTRFAVPFHVNALTVDPAGARALAWFDLAAARPGEDASALQQVAVLDLAADTLETVVVGYRPTRIEFAPDGAALVVTEDGLSVIAREAAPGPAPIVPLAPDLGDFGAREVILGPDARHAASRAEGEAGVTIVDLFEGVPRFVPLGAIPTDLDRLPDGRMLAMLPTADRLAIVPFELDPAVIDDPDALAAAITTVPLRGVYLGAAAVGEDGRRAFLYTTTDPLNGPGVAGLLAPETGALVFTPLRKAARGAEVDPSGRVAVVLHGRAAGPPPAGDPSALVRHSHGYSVVDLDTAFVKLETTPAEPSGLVFAPDRAAAFLRLSSADDPQATSRVAAVQRIDLRGLSVRTWAVGSPPEIVGVLPALERAFVTQTHPTGRISFLRLDDPEAPIETVTGYALNGRIE